MALEKNGMDVEPLSSEQFDELNNELWEIFRYYKGKQGRDNDYCRTAATAALGIIQLQALKPRA